MATTPTSVRVEEEKLEQFKAMQREIGSGAEFSNWALEMYKMHESTKTSDQFAKNIQSIKGMMEAIVGAINGIISTAEGSILAKDADIAKDLMDKDEMIGDLKAEMELLREELKSKDIEISNRDVKIKEVEKDLEENQKVLDKAQKDFATTSKLNEMLMKEKARYEAIEETNKQLAVDNEELSDKLSEVEKQVNEAMQKITALETQKQSLEQSYIDKITSLKDKHRQALDHADALKGVAIKEAKADAREEAQAKIEAHIEEETKLRKEVDGLMKDVYASNNSIREMQDIHLKEVTVLKEEIEKLKTKTLTEVSKEETLVVKEAPTKTNKNKRSKANVDANTETNTDR